MNPEPVPVAEFIANRRKALAGKAITVAELEGVQPRTMEAARQEEIKTYIRCYFATRHQTQSPITHRARVATCRYWCLQLRRRRAVGWG